MRVISGNQNGLSVNLTLVFLFCSEKAGMSMPRAPNKKPEIT